MKIEIFGYGMNVETAVKELNVTATFTRESEYYNSSISD
jgi:hypothetical protein